jgi:hypothetical protein
MATSLRRHGHECADLQRLFGRVLEFIADRNDDLINKVIEVLRDGTVHVREWTSDHHDIGYISNPEWTPQ